ncbi:FAD/NAD(P)-binding domain-containing protein [Hypoxylon rubiginosum]|uniref:FAD/NAD(P)-binding domain-containing protein n=1 Tax=Hypoxylon rubiginosum TaxID=110542 RepID=A0ACC0DE99_9PEZI|nr:FAD/NAD(P)-binding domain-containing protein [Hypoxylon rubiginosum]
MPKRLRIAVIGAGPAGCTLARLLHLSPAPTSVMIFEREQHLHDRDQGGTLDLHEETGLAALRSARLADTPEFAAIARRDGDSMVLCDKHMRRWIDLKSTKDGGWFAEGKPEVDRLALRKLLLDSLPEGTVVWSKAVAKVHLSTDGTSTIAFTDGTIEPGFDLVVGADGTRSVVRPLVTQAEPFYSGVGGWNMLCPNAATTRPMLNNLVRRGSLFAYSDGKSLMGQQLGTGDLYIGMFSLKPENWQRTSGYDVNDPKAVKNALLEEFKNWAPELREIIASIDESKVWPRNLMTLPTGFRWDPKPGITLMGDAAHVMCPFVGQGVNAAMADAMELSRAIEAASDEQWSRQSLDGHIRQYERMMWDRVRRAQKLTEDMMGLMLLTPGAPASVIEKYVVRATTDDMNIILASIWGFFVWLYYLFVKTLHTL